MSVPVTRNSKGVASHAINDQVRLEANIVIPSAFSSSNHIKFELGTHVYREPVTKTLQTEYINPQKSVFSHARSTASFHSTNGPFASLAASNVINKSTTSFISGDDGEEYFQIDDKKPIRTHAFLELSGSQASIFVGDPRIVKNNEISKTKHKIKKDEFFSFGNQSIAADYSLHRPIAAPNANQLTTENLISTRNEAQKYHKVASLEKQKAEMFMLEREAEQIRLSVKQDIHHRIDVKKKLQMFKQKIIKHMKDTRDSRLKLVGRILTEEVLLNFLDAYSGQKLPIDVVLSLIISSVDKYNMDDEYSNGGAESDQLFQYSDDDSPNYPPAINRLNSTMSTSSLSVNIMPSTHEPPAPPYLETQSRTKLPAHVVTSIRKPILGAGFRVNKHRSTSPVTQEVSSPSNRKKNNSKNNNQNDPSAARISIDQTLQEIGEMHEALLRGEQHAAAAELGHENSYESRPDTGNRPNRKINLNISNEQTALDSYNSMDLMSGRASEDLSYDGNDNSRLKSTSNAMITSHVGNSVVINGLGIQGFGSESMSTQLLDSLDNSMAQSKSKLDVFFDTESFSVLTPATAFVDSFAEETAKALQGSSGSAISAKISKRNQLANNNAKVSVPESTLVLTPAIVCGKESNMWKPKYSGYMGIGKNSTNGRPISTKRRYLSPERPFISAS